MTTLLMILLCGARFTGVDVGNFWTYVAIDGDSNTDSGWLDPDSSWAKQANHLLGYDSDGYVFYNVAYSGKEVYDMVQADTVLFDDKFRTGGICIMLGGHNDIGHGASADSTYSLIEEYCTARQNAGWYMIVMTYPTIVPDMITVNNSIQANWATFADEIIDLAEAPNIGEAADHNNPVYFYDTVHLSVTGLGIVADSVYKHLEALR